MPRSHLRCLRDGAPRYPPSTVIRPREDVILTLSCAPLLPPSPTTPHEAELNALWVSHPANEPFAVRLFVQHSPAETLDEVVGYLPVIDPEIEM